MNNPRQISEDSFVDEIVDNKILISYIKALETQNDLKNLEIVKLKQEIMRLKDIIKKSPK